MTQITHLDASTATRDTILKVVDREAAVILENALTASQVRGDPPGTRAVYRRDRAL